MHESEMHGEAPRDQPKAEVGREAPRDQPTENNPHMRVVNVKQFKRRANRQMESDEGGARVSKSSRVTMDGWVETVTMVPTGPCICPDCPPIGGGGDEEAV